MYSPSYLWKVYSQPLITMAKTSVKPWKKIDLKNPTKFLLFRTNVYFNGLTFNIFCCSWIFKFYCLYILCSLFLSVLLKNIVFFTFSGFPLIRFCITDFMILSIFCYSVCFSRKFVRLPMILLIIQLYSNIYSVNIYVDMKCIPASSAVDFADNFTKIYSPYFFPKKYSEI